MNWSRPFIQIKAGNNVHWCIRAIIGFSLILSSGCAAISRHVSAEKSYPELAKNPCGEVYLYCSWFRGMFGDGKPVWDGLCSDNELVIGLHPATKSEFDFKVRSYPSVYPQFTNKVDFLREIAREIETQNNIEITSEKIETISIEQSYNKNGILAFFQKVDWLCFGITTFLALTVYLLTLAPDVTLENAGIYPTAAMFPSPSIPPGHPIWAVYGWLFVKLVPFSNIAWRLNLASAVAGSTNLRPDCVDGLVGRNSSGGKHPQSEDPLFT